MSSGRMPVGLVGLDVDALDPAAIDEVVDVGPAPCGGDRLVDLADVETERARLVLVDLDIELRRVFEADRADPGQPLSCIASSSILLRASVSFAWPRSPVSTNCRSKPVALPSSSAAGGMNETISASRYCDSAPDRAVGDRLRRIRLALAVVPRLQRQERDPGILPLPGEGEAADGEHAFDIILFLGQEMLLDMLQRAVGARQGGAGRFGDQA